MIKGCLLKRTLAKMNKNSTDFLFSPFFVSVGSSLSELTSERRFVFGLLKKKRHFKVKREPLDSKRALKNPSLSILSVRFYVDFIGPATTRCI